MGLKIAITGTSGYLGGELLKTLLFNENIDSINNIYHNHPLNIHHSKLTEYALNDLDEAIHDTNYVIHFGALYKTQTDIETVTELVQSNIQTTAEIFDSARRQPDCKVIMPTTFSMLSHDNSMYTPKTIYAATKMFDEIIAESMGVDVIFLRLGDTFGDNDHRKKIVNIMLDAVNNQQELTLQKPQDFKMNIINVRDLCNIVNLILSQNNHDISGVKKYDLFYPENTVTMKEIVNIIDPEQKYIHFPNINVDQEIVTQRYYFHYIIQYNILDSLRKVMQEEH